MNFLTQLRQFEKARIFSTLVFPTLPMMEPPAKLAKEVVFPLISPKKVWIDSLTSSF
jgi:hypothetical protein